jgi:hypothetical protein
MHRIKQLMSEIYGNIFNFLYIIFPEYPAPLPGSALHTLETTVLCNALTRCEKLITKLRTDFLLLSNVRMLRLNIHYEPYILTEIVQKEIKNVSLKINL